VVGAAYPPFIELRKPAIDRFINFCWFFKLGATWYWSRQWRSGSIYHADGRRNPPAGATTSPAFPSPASAWAARMVEGRGIAVYDLTISETSTNLQNNLLVVDEMMLVCDTAFPVVHGLASRNG
jgi:hypothetical protein